MSLIGASLVLENTKSTLHTFGTDTQMLYKLVLRHHKMLATGSYVFLYVKIQCILETLNLVASVNLPVYHSIWLYLVRTVSHPMKYSGSIMFE